MNLDIDKDWFAKKAAQEGDLEIGAGGRKTLTVNLTPDEVAVLERLVNPEAAAQRARNTELSKAIEHWRHEVGKLHSQIDTLKGRLDEAGRTADARKVVIEQRDARIATLSAENERLRKALEQIDAAASAAYCASLRQFEKDECLGWVRKVEAGKFGEAEHKAHQQANMLMGKSQGLWEALKIARAVLEAKP